ncbi:alpha/beta hydrolase [Specibacter cremeus]|uniref:alpha/beta hydrolase n=1 Tax=Specibacter cremeus TaxID=1629051 RepID=UPI001F0CA6E8|nr:alpha/beta hydrolase [Specibacter cremeus]
MIFARHERRRPRRRLTAATALAGLAALLLSACSAAPPTTTGTTITAQAGPSVIGDVPTALSSFYAQVVTWTSCNETFLCTDVQVPVDYTKPDGDTIKLALIKLPASGKRLGSLLTNPGGPGGSGVDFVLDGAKTVFSTRLRGSYDIVGFDPRGVQRSAPVKCISDAQTDQERQQSLDLGNDVDLKRAQAQAQRDTAECVKNTGPVLGYVDTVSSARDMDILRAVLGDPKLDYMGFSYGTKLGATYAGLFPRRVGKFSLDGALDPSLGVDAVAMGQAKGFEQAIRHWAGYCLEQKDCPFSGTVDDVLAGIHALQAAYLADPPRARDGRLVPESEFTNALAYGMYSTSLWEPLSRALAEAVKGDPSAMLALADYSADRNADGKYTSNTSAAFLAINCLDYPMDADVAHMRAEAAALQKASPTFGRLLGYSALGCTDWPFQATGKPAKIAAPGAGPILVVGTTGDPATPYAWAQSLAAQLDSGVLVTWNGDGHTAYGRSNACLKKAVDDYFVDGTVPARGTTC